MAFMVFSSLCSIRLSSIHARLTTYSAPSSFQIFRLFFLTNRALPRQVQTVRLSQAWLRSSAIEGSSRPTTLAMIWNRDWKRSHARQRTLVAQPLPNDVQLRPALSRRQQTHRATRRAALQPRQQVPKLQRQSNSCRLRRSRRATPWMAHQQLLR